MAHPLLKHAFAEWSDAAIEKTEKCPIYTTVIRVGEDLEINQGLTVQDETARLSNRIVPSKVAQGEKITFNLEGPEILDQGTKGRHEELLLSSFAQGLWPDLDVIPVFRHKVAAGIDFSAGDVGCPEFLSRLEVIPDGSRPSVVLQDPHRFDRHTRLL